MSKLARIKDADLDTFPETEGYGHVEISARILPELGQACCHAPNTSSQYGKYQILIAYALKHKGKENAM